MLHKDFGLVEIKAADNSGLVEGYGSTFGGAPDSYGDVVMPGAFTDSLVKHKRAGTMPLMLWGHQTGEPPIGNWKDMAEDGKGLWVQGQINLDDPLGQRVHMGLKSKAIRGLSIGYEVVQSAEDPKRQGVRLLQKLDLWEISPVNFPANTRATVTAVKNIIDGGGLPTVRQFEDFLRDAGGFSKSLAAAIASKAQPLLNRGEPDAADELAQFLRGLNA